MYVIDMQKINTFLHLALGWLKLFWVYGVIARIMLSGKRVEVLCDSKHPFSIIILEEKTRKK